MSEEGPVQAEGEREAIEAARIERREAALSMVVKFGDPVLKSKASPVSEFDAELRAEADRMIQIMQEGMGVGLAATQLAVLRRLLVFQAGPDSEPVALVNPTIEWLSDELATAEEGCLSLPLISVEVERALHARVAGRDVEGEPLQIEASGLEARVLQHEIDHLDGVLILDRTQREQRKGALRALREGGSYSPPGAELDSVSEPGEHREPRAGRVKTVYLGTSDFAAEVLRRLASSEHRPQLVVAPPSRPRGRGRRTQPPPTAAAAAELGIELLQTADLNQAEAIERLRAACAQVGAVCAFGQLIREPLLSELPLLNVHPSLLPRWRGAAPIERAIMAGDELTGASVMRVTEGLDSGPIALQEELPIRPDDDFAKLSERLAGLGGELLVRALDDEERGALQLRDQDDALATYAEKIAPSERRLDPALPAAELARRVRALTPHIGAYLELADGSRLGVRRSRPVDVGVRQGEMRAEWGALLLGCGPGTLRLEVVQPQGGRPMEADAFMRGHSLPAL